MLSVLLVLLSSSDQQTFPPPFFTIFVLWHVGHVEHEGPGFYGRHRMGSARHGHGAEANGVLFVCVVQIVLVLCLMIEPAVSIYIGRFGGGRGATCCR